MKANVLNKEIVHSRHALKDTIPTLQCTAYWLASEEQWMCTCIKSVWGPPLLIREANAFSLDITCVCVYNARPTAIVWRLII